MNHTLPHRFGALVLLMLISASAAVPAYAATSSRYSFSNMRYYGSGRGVSSSAQRAISALDKDPVEDLPIPVLLGVAPSNLWPNFGDPRDGGARTHEGEDIMAPKDDYIVSPTDAVVTSMGTGDSAGKYVYTANPGNETFAYMHLDKFADGLKAGSVLKEGGLIGYVGNTGDAAGGATHLHFEIRHGREATDPFPRLTKEFSLDDRIEYVTRALKDADDDSLDAQTLVQISRGTFIAARAAGMKLPSAIEDALGAQGATVAFARDLSLGSQGDDVIALQEIVITADSGPQARALASAGATGYFGALTKAALIEYQSAKGILPASGYFGPLTRAQISSGSIK